MMENFRANPPKELGGSPIVLTKDYKVMKQTDNAGNVSDIDMPEPLERHPVLLRGRHEGLRTSSRTEPKIKVLH